MIQTVKVRPGAFEVNHSLNQSYDIKIGSGLMEKAGILFRDSRLSEKTIIITDSTVNKIYGSRLQRILSSEGFTSFILEVPVGEDQKCLDTAARLYSELSKLNTERTTTIVALGGGVIGDLAGFVAATYMRGVALVQIPTTLLAQCDSSIGGKVAVNHGNLKNQIGTFYHPKLTISDTDTLKTLSVREFCDGLAEVIKYGIIQDDQFFSYLENSIKQIRNLEETALAYIVSRSATIKSGIVEKDEFDLGLRNILNFGHTIGHAIESVSNLSIWHGEAVAIGMIIESKISETLKLLSKDEVERITKLLKVSGLSVEIPNLDRDQIIEAMYHDKKANRGKLKFALPQGIGKVEIIDDIPVEIIKKALG
jgi:3-dehydroquinate synthase